jgi:hypothetical protein
MSAPAELGWFSAQPKIDGALMVYRGFAVSVYRKSTARGPATM